MSEHLCPVSFLPGMDWSVASSDVSNTWIDLDKTKVGYEIPFNRHFYVFTPPRPLEVIDAELKQVTDRILEMIGGRSA
jgi:type I restriction enzyme M protein